MKRLPIVLAALLAGCTSTINGVTPAPTASPSGLTVSLQRAEAQAGIASAESIQTASIFAAFLSQLPLGGGTLPTGKCVNGVKTTVKVLNPEQLSILAQLFYEPTCKKLLASASLKTTYFPGGSLQVVGTTTVYGGNGKPLLYGTLSSKGTATASSAQLVTKVSLSKSPKATPVLAFGMTCTLGTKNSCGYAAIAVDASQSIAFGVSATIDGFLASGAGTGSVAMNEFMGPVGSLRIVQEMNHAWTVKGGTLIASPAGSFFENVDAKALNVSGTLAMKDLRNGAQLSLEYGTRTGIGKGSVSSLSPAQRFATFSTDALGTGSIAYSQGTGSILLFVILN